MRLRGGNLLLAVVLGTVAASLPAIASSETTPTVSALAPYSWSPNAQTVTAGGAVAFQNMSAINHGIIWTGGTAGATPTCNTGVGDDIPIGKENWSTSWHGSCTFAKAGTYTYECSFHMALMRGTITATVPGAPTATTEPAAAVGETEATLKGTVDPQGKATTYFFNYGTSTSYGSRTVEQSAGEASEGKSVALPVSSLSPGTTYHFQLVAKNAAATIPGEDRTFTTSSPPGAPPAPTPPPPPAPPTPIASPAPPVAPPPATPPLAIAPAAPVAPAGPVAPLAGSPLLGSPSLSSSQHGSTVHGSLEVSPSGAGGHLEVDLLASSASVAKTGHLTQLRVGGLVRGPVAAGKVSFVVALDAKAKAALRRHGRLALTVKIVLTPTHGAPSTITRAVLLRA
jgi:plastocyanin